MSLDRWKQSVVHLEVAATSSAASSEQERIINQITSVSDPDELRRLVSDLPLGKDARFRGTALFLTDGRKRYLVTARHVVHDQALAEEHEDQVPSHDWPPGRRAARIAEWIFPIIFRVPRLDEAKVDRVSPPDFLMNLGAGGPSAYSYSVDEDLAVISLDQRDSKFADGLEAEGITPVDLSNVGFHPSGEGVPIMAVGYPDSVSVLGEKPQMPAVHAWSSAAVSLPTFSFGHVAMMHDRLPYFWADLSIYPGSSGGPVIEGNSVVGVVSQQATTDVDGDPGRRVRIPFALVIHASSVHRLLEEQRVKDDMVAERKLRK